MWHPSNILDTSRIAIVPPWPGVNGCLAHSATVARCQRAHGVCCPDDTSARWARCHGATVAEWSIVDASSIAPWPGQGQGGNVPKTPRPLEVPPVEAVAVMALTGVPLEKIGGILPILPPYHPTNLPQLVDTVTIGT